MLNLKSIILSIALQIFCCSVDGDAPLNIPLDLGPASPLLPEGTSRLSADMAAHLIPAKKWKGGEAGGEQVEELSVLKSSMDLEEYRHMQQDEEELFGCSVAAVLKRFTNHQKAVAKFRIQKVLFDVEFPESDAHPPNE